MLSKLMFYLLLLALLSGAAYWFSSGSGDMVLGWQDYELTTTTANFVFLMVLVIVLLAVVIPGLIGLFGLPRKWMKAREDKKFREGLDYVTQTLASIAIGDAKSARLHLNKAKKSYKELPIIPLLETQLAAATKDQDLLVSSLNELQKFEQTKALASKGLAEVHMRKGELISAIPYAQKAMELEPKNKQSFLITLSLYIKSKQFIYADGLIEDALKQKIINKHERREFMALVAYMRSLQDDLSHEEALVLIEAAYQQASHAPHVFIRYIQLHNDASHIGAAVKVLKRSWEGCFTPALYHLAKELNLDNQEQKKIYSKLRGLSLAGKPYAHLLLANLAATQDDLKESLKHLNAYRQITQTELALPMPTSDYDVLALNEVVSIIEQLEAEIPSLRWTCESCEKQSEIWQVICPGCQALNNYSIVNS